MVKSLIMYLSALRFNNYGPVIPDHVHEYYTSISSEYYRSSFDIQCRLMILRHKIPQHVNEYHYYSEGQL